MAAVVTSRTRPNRDVRAAKRGLRGRGNCKTNDFLARERARLP
jgi:hypothetical protein